MRTPRPFVPREFWILIALEAVFLVAAAVALATDQPQGIYSLALGLALGINLGAVVMLGAVRKARPA